MPDTFELFRLSLLLRPQKSIFDAHKKDPTREEHLRKVFSEKHAFQRARADFYYVPSVKHSIEEALLGRIGRQVLSEENMPPEKDLEEVVHKSWKAVVIALDPRPHDDGQKVSIQVDTRIGTPFSLLSALVKAINEKYPESAYNIEVQPIFDAETFWDFAKKNEGNITSIRFRFIVPNMFGVKDDLSKELKSFGKVEKAQTVDIGVTSRDGIEPDTERIRESVDYAQKGGGIIKAAARGGKSYSSTEKPKKVSLREPEPDEEPLLKRALKNISKVFGRG